jgi:hypothetical protein
VVSRLLFAALQAAATTNGLVDPTVGSSLRAMGYDRDFDVVVRRGKRFYLGVDDPVQVIDDAVAVTPRPRVPRCVTQEPAGPPAAAMKNSIAPLFRFPAVSQGAPASWVV